MEQDEPIHIFDKLKERQIFYRTHSPEINDLKLLTDVVLYQQVLIERLEQKVSEPSPETKLYC